VAGAAPPARFSCDATTACRGLLLLLAEVIIGLPLTVVWLPFGIVVILAQLVFCRQNLHERDDYGRPRCLNVLFMPVFLIYMCATLMADDS
jgi:hypothetical protein